MRWFASVLGSMLVAFLHFFSKGSGSPSLHTKMAKLGQSTHPLTLRQGKTTSFAVSKSSSEPSKVMANEVENQFINGYINQTSMELPADEFEEALQAMLSAKIIQEVEIGGQTFYQLTPIGRAVARHRYHTNPKEQN